MLHGIRSKPSGIFGPIAGSLPKIKPNAPVAVYNRIFLRRGDRLSRRCRDCPWRIKTIPRLL